MDASKVFHPVGAAVDGTRLAKQARTVATPCGPVGRLGSRDLKAGEPLHPGGPAQRATARRATPAQTSR